MPQFLDAGFTTVSPRVTAPEVILELRRRTAAGVSSRVRACLRLAASPLPPALPHPPAEGAEPRRAMPARLEYVGSAAPTETSAAGAIPRAETIKAVEAHLVWVRLHQDRHHRHARRPREGTLAAELFSSMYRRSPML